MKRPETLTERQHEAAYAVEQADKSALERQSYRATRPYAPAFAEALAYQVSRMKAGKISPLSETFSPTQTE